jgi:penicillin amidase/acyl-homoserine-lactone acylase
VVVYQLQLNPKDENQYWMDAKWHDLKVQEAEILVKLFGPIRWTFKRPLYLFAHGPVLKLDYDVFALRWYGRNAHARAIPSPKQGKK